MEVLSVTIGTASIPGSLVLPVTLTPSVMTDKALNSSVPHCDSKRQVLLRC